MFELYTEKARRVIFFARYEASQFGSPYIETDHLLLGLLREDKALTNRFLHSHGSVESIRKQIEAHTTVRESIATSVDLPLSNECKRVLSFAAEEAETLSHKHIGTEHLLLGLLREDKCFAAELLRERGVHLDDVREQLRQATHESPQAVSVFGTGSFAAGSPAVSVAPIYHDLTQAASEGKLSPVIGRSLELDAGIEILSSFYQPNPVLIGDRGVGKTTIVHALAQRIVDGSVPPSLAGKRIFSLEAAQLFDVPRLRPRGEEAIKTLKTLAASSNAILFIDDLPALFASGSRTAPADTTTQLKHALLDGELKCITACTPSDYHAAVQTLPWIAACFRSVYVRPLDETTTHAVLQSRKTSLEKFHEVTYAEESLAFAVNAAGRYLPNLPLPAKALHLLDAAGSLAKTRRTTPPEEIAEIEKRLRFINQRMENSIANHEFEKARFYSDEERKERDALRAAREKHHLDDATADIVGPQLLDEVINRWSSYPYSL
ncbi:MAG: Clp protease N-terminal domain-containing protein [Acidobacteriaceae bacterium]